jgi:methionyl-tRNA formyltransferase
VEVPMKVVFMGTPDFSVPALEKIAQNHQVQAVVTQQDRPKGRGHKMQYTPVKEKALELNIPVFQPEKVKNPEFVDILKEMNPDVIVVIAFGQILSKEILDLPKYGCINVHASLLPEYRGAAPIQWAVIDGKKESGVTTMYMAEGLDTGDIIDKKVIELDKKETGGSLFDRLSLIGGDLILETLKHLEDGTAKRIPQDDEKSSYAGKITKELGHIDFTKSAVEIEQLIRGLNPWPSAFVHVDDKTLKIWDADVIDEPVKEEPGTIISTNKTLKVATGDGYLDIKELQLAGKKRMDSVSFLNGYSIKSEKMI